MSCVWMLQRGHSGTGGVLDMCLCFKCGGVGGELAWTRVGVVLCLCEV